MNIAKNMEAVFLVAAIGFTCASAIASSNVWHAAPSHRAAMSSVDASNIVVVKTHRLSAAEKAQLGD